MRANKYNTNHFFDPGGGIDEGESTIDALHREVFEELSVKVTRETFVTKRTFATHCHPDTFFDEDVYIVQIDGEPKPSDEIDEIRFVTYDESKTMEIMDSTRDLIEIAKKRKLIV